MVESKKGERIDMQKLKVAIIGGGASGLFLASMLPADGVCVFERADRVGKKLSATGNGQGNVSNAFCKDTRYFSFSSRGERLAKKQLNRYGFDEISTYLKSLGVLLTVDERGRAYPASKQASSLTDALRFALLKKGTQIRLGQAVTQIEKSQDGFVITAGEERFFAQVVVLCTGGKCAKNFGTDGLGYTLAQSLSHTLTPLYPALVQLKTDTKDIKTLKGIRVSPALVKASWQEQGELVEECVQGDLLFTEYGVSGDAIFRLSAFFTDKIEQGVCLHINFLPQFTREEIFSVLQSKQTIVPDTEIFSGIVNNQIGRAVVKKAGDGSLETLVNLVQNFPLQVKGTLGFDYAQVTKGGVRLEEVDDDLQSTLAKGLYFAGEILDIDGQCGGFNVQWAYASACTVADALLRKERGQV